jgi:Sec-independent protein translocase protein TatA
MIAASIPWWGWVLGVVVILIVVGLVLLAVIGKALGEWGES